MADFTIIILTLDEEVHLPRLLESIGELHARICVMDSGSTDHTLDICKRNNIEVSYRAFDNHPKQWDAALKKFRIVTPWIIGLDADHVVSPELLGMLKGFKKEDYAGIDGIYFNRKNHYRGKWIKHGGYYPVYLLKMFRSGVGFSDLNENMDHRFIVPGKTIIWKKGHLIEENLKENDLRFWIAKHNRYSDLLAEEECGRIQNLRTQFTKRRYWGSPNERKAWLKDFWSKLPRYLRPFLYFGYRMTIQLGFLDGKRGIIFHFLQGFWFRLIVDIKIEERQARLVQQDIFDRPIRCTHPCIRPLKQSLHDLWNLKQYRFLMLFPLLFAVLYGFNIAFIGVTCPGRLYLGFLDKHLNYIQAWRHLTITTTSTILGGLGYHVSTSAQYLRVSGHAGFNLVYSCLGYGVMSFFAAFVISFPRDTGTKWKFLSCGLLTIQALNLVRFVTIAIYWRQTDSKLSGHHTLFNILIYGVLLLMIYLWTNNQSNRSPGTPRTETD
jgi:exosortase/archaeosortase family protein